MNQQNFQNRIFLDPKLQKIITLLFYYSDNYIILL
jgi:hypothetical protein